MNKREQLISVIVADDSYKTICQKINKRFADDIYQEVCEAILTVKKLPELSHLKYWFYATARNVITAGSLSHMRNYLPEEKVSQIKPCLIHFHSGYQTGAKYLNKPDEHENENREEKKIRKAESIIISLTEKENRALQIFAQTGSMSEVAKRTGIKYKELLQIRKSMIGRL